MWPRPPVTERRDPDGRATRVGYVLRRCGFERHCGIVTRVCLVKEGRGHEASTVVTASRDVTLKCWDIPAASAAPEAPVPQLRCSLEEHTAWVNDAIVLPPTTVSTDAAKDSHRIVSASSDNLVKVWHVDEERQGVGVSGAMMSLRYHVDYVTCLAYAPHRSLLVSAGFDSRVVVSDLEAATRIVSFPNDTDDQYTQSSGRASASRGRDPAAAHRCTVGSFSGSGQYIPNLLLSRQDGTGEDGREGNSCGSSVWSLATTRNSSLLVCGTASCVVRGWDPRCGARLWKLKGHTENVRALVLSEDGTLCISGSADRTVRVWDIGMRRCVHVFEAHHDSVWALATAGCSCGWSKSASVDGTLSEVFSGGRDGLVLLHDLRQLQTSLVVREPSPLQGLAVSTDSTEVWAPAADSHVRHHTVPGNLVPYSPLVGINTDTVPPPGAAPMPIPGLPPPAGDHCIAIPGTPRLVDYKVLHNKRQVLVRDASDQLSLWDVTNGSVVDFALPAAPPSGSTADPAKDDVMKRALAQVNKPISVPNWFSCDLSLGSLSVYLDSNHCFKAEAEAPGAPVNVGAKTLSSLFDSWVRLPPGGGQAAGANQATRGGSSSSGGSRRTSGTQPRIFVAQQPANDAPSPSGAAANGGDQRWDDEQPPGTPTDQDIPAEAPAGGSSSSNFPPATALMLVGRNGRATGYRGRLYCSLFNGTEVPDLLPPWVVDVVWNQAPPPEELCGDRNLLFTVMRCPTELGLPALQVPWCVAAPRTPVLQLMGYLVRTLEFDWSTPSKSSARRRGSTGSLVSRLGRCFPVGTSRARAASADLNDDGDGASTPRSNRSGGSTRRSASANRERSAALNGSQSSAQRRAFGIRRGDEEAPPGPTTAAGRVRIDGGPAPLQNAPAQGNAAKKNGNAAAATAMPEERFVEVLCNDLVVEPGMSVATVRDFLWRKPGHEMVLTYRRAKHVAMPSFSAPPPPLLSPGSTQQSQSPVTSSVANAAGNSDVKEDMSPDMNGSDSASPNGRAMDGSPQSSGGPPRE